MECHLARGHFAPRELINRNGDVNRPINKNKVQSSSEMGFAQRIKPMFFVPENEIRKYAQEKKFPILYDRCPCAIGTYRVETRAWLDKLGNEQKLNVVENFQKEIPRLKKKFETGAKVMECKYCGEPARGEICNACRIFECFKEM
jgi:tRNA-5-methyluridine54 2-sulfurtransferase